MQTQYLQLHANSHVSELPDLTNLQPFKLILVAELSVDRKFQSSICRWLVASGCAYLMAWGNDCCAWADAVERENLEAFPNDEIPDARVIITTWHEDELLNEVFWFSKYSAMHPCFALDNLLILHLADETRRDELLDAYAVA